MTVISKNKIDFRWQDQALCKGLATEMFFPTQGELVDPILVQTCEDCPVQKQCLEHALHHEHYGYWAGTSEKQRVSIRKKMNINCHKPEALYWMDSSMARKESEANRVKISGRGRKPKSNVSI